MKEHDEKGICRDGQDSLQDQCPEHADKSVGTRSSYVRIVVFRKRTGNQGFEVDILLKQG